jgi:hypothetical protein
MWQRIDFALIIDWLRGDYVPTEPFLSPNEALVFAMFTLARDRARTAARTRRLREDEDAIFRWRRM